MNPLYQKTFDQVCLPEKRARALRTALASRCSQTETEAINMNHFLRRPTALLTAILLVSVLTLTTLACGGQIAEHIYTFLSGGTITQGTDETGMAYSSGSINTAIPLVETGKDGRVYLTAGGETLDITGKFSYTEPFLYECTGEDGLRHVLVVGGEPDAIGWSEFLWNEAGLPVGGSSQFGTPAGREDAPWLDTALETLGLPW